MNNVDLPTFGRPTIATEKMPSSSRVVRVGFVLLLGREDLDDRVEQLTRQAAVQRGDRHRITEPEARELPDVALAAFVVDFVDRDDHRVRRALQHLRDARVLFRDADGDVDHEHDHVRGLDRGVGLRAHLRRERGLLAGEARITRGEPAARVDDLEPAGLPLGVEGLAVARDTGPLLDDRVAPADDPVDEGRLADVRPSDDRDGGELAGHAACDRSAATSDAPSVAHDLDRSGQVGDRRAVEEATARQRDVREEVAAVGGRAGEDACEVGTGEQAGDTDVAAEEPVLDREQLHVAGQLGHATARAPARRACP